MIVPPLADTQVTFTDNTTGDATAAAHGYMPKASVTKLAGIETAADVTDATNVALAGAVMDGDLGTNVATALAVNVGTDGAFVVKGGAGGTPSSLTLTNATGYPDAGQKVELVVACSDETTALTTGVKVTFRMPLAMTLGAGKLGLRASLVTAATDSTFIVDVKASGTSLMTTNLLTLDDGEKTSYTAATEPNITDTGLALDEEVEISVAQKGTTVAGAGLKVAFIGVRA